MERNLPLGDLYLIEPRKTIKTVTAKIICIGDCSVGKTSIIRRFIQDRFKETSSTTLGLFLQETAEKQLFFS